MQYEHSETEYPPTPLDAHSALLNAISNDVRRLLKTVHMLENSWKRIDELSKHSDLLSANLHMALIKIEKYKEKERRNVQTTKQRGAKRGKLRQPSKAK